MAIICSGYAGTGTRIVGMWDAALHVQYVVSIANSAMDVDWLPARLPGCLAAVYNPVACLLSVQLGGPSPKVLTASLCIQILGMRHCHSTICSISFFFLFSIFLPSSTLFFLCVLSLLAAHSHSTLISARILASHFYSLSMLFVRFGTTNMVEFIFCSLFYRVLVPPPTPRFPAPVPALCGVG